MKSKKGSKSSVVQMLSPKKYIETKARTLPIYECYVNTGWREAKMADVLVMRRHTNGRITAALFLVDLLCLGVKDSIYFYNEEESDIRERFFKSNPYHQTFEKIDYALAHNIVYAGHDFAMDYDIKPHESFATTKYILEEDNNDIPLIEIETGDEEGAPLLMVRYPGQYSDALLKLKKNAGEGNYTYIVGDAEDGEDIDAEADDEEEDDDYEDWYSIDDYEVGEIGPYEASMIKTEDLANIEGLQHRSGEEKISLHAEAMLRLLLNDHEELYYKEGPEFDWIENRQTYPESLDEDQIADYKSGMEAFSELKVDDVKNHSIIHAHIARILDQYSPNVLLVASFHTYRPLSPDDKLLEKTTAILDALGPSHPLAVLILTLTNLLNSIHTDQIESICQEEDIYRLFPETKAFAAIELLLFFLIKVARFSENGNLKEAVRYYQLICQMDIVNWATTPVQFAFIDLLAKTIKSEFTDKEMPEED